MQIGYSLQNSNTSTIFESLGADHFAYSYYIGGAILLFTVLFTALRTREYPPEEFSKYSEEVLPEGGAESSTRDFSAVGLSAEPASGTAAVAEQRPSFIELMRHIPRVMLPLGVVQYLFDSDARSMIGLAGADGFGGRFGLLRARKKVIQR